MDTIWKLLYYIRDRLKEPSTYPALVLVLSAIGHTLAPDQKDAIMIVGIFLAGMIGAVLPDRIGKNTRADDPDKTLPPQPPKGTTP